MRIKSCRRSLAFGHSSSAVIGYGLRQTTTDERPATTDFHDREACRLRQTAAHRALCYNHSFPQPLRGTLVSPSGTPACPANPRVLAAHLRSRFAEDRGRAAAPD